MKIVKVYWKTGGITTMTINKEIRVLEAYEAVLAYIVAITETDVDTHEVKMIYKSEGVK